MFWFCCLLQRSTIICVWPFENRKFDFNIIIIPLWECFLELSLIYITREYYYCYDYIGSSDLIQVHDRFKTIRWPAQSCRPWHRLIWWHSEWAFRYICFDVIPNKHIKDRKKQGSGGWLDDRLPAVDLSRPRHKNSDSCNEFLSVVSIYTVTLWWWSAHRIIDYISMKWSYTYSR